MFKNKFIPLTLLSLFVLMGFHVEQKYLVKSFNVKTTEMFFTHKVNGVYHKDVKDDNVIDDIGEHLHLPYANQWNYFKRGIDHWVLPAGDSKQWGHKMTGVDPRDNSPESTNQWGQMDSTDNDNYNVNSWLNKRTKRYPAPVCKEGYHPERSYGTIDVSQWQDTPTTPYTDRESNRDHLKTLWTGGFKATCKEYLQCPAGKRRIVRQGLYHCEGAGTEINPSYHLSGGKCPAGSVLDKEFKNIGGNDILYKVRCIAAPATPASGTN